jgi:hypothetical protein
MARKPSTDEIPDVNAGDEDDGALSPPTVKAGDADKRHILRRLFGIGVWGGFKLTLLCIVVGFFVMAANFDPAAQDTNVLSAVAGVAKQAAAAAGWAARNFWQPALAGAGIVLPIWVLWRLVSLPFRK